jgi:hypothetical protein
MTIAKCALDNLNCPSSSVISFSPLPARATKPATHKLPKLPTTPNLLITPNTMTSPLMFSSRLLLNALDIYTQPSLTSLNSSSPGLPMLLPVQHTNYSFFTPLHMPSPTSQLLFSARPAFNLHPLRSSLSCHLPPSLLPFDGPQNSAFTAAVTTPHPALLPSQTALSVAALTPCSLRAPPLPLP